MVSTATAAAVAVDTNGTTSFNDDVPLSVQASTTVKVVHDALFDFSTIMGKVYHDRNGDGVQNEGEEPIPHAVLLTSAGQQIRTDINAFISVRICCPAEVNNTA